MIKKFIMALVLGVMCISVSQAAAPKKIVGATAYQVTDLPSGVCESGVFTMTSAGFFSTAVDTTQVTLGIGPTENNNSGYVYVLVGNVGANTSQIVQVDMNTLVQSSSGNVDIAVNNPDTVSSHTLSSYYDTNVRRMTVLGNTTATTCTGSTQSCIHIRQYNQVTNVVDSVTASGTENAAPAPAFGSTFDNSGRVWIPYRVTPAGSQLLGEYSGFILSKTVTMVTGSNYMNGLGNDSTYIYASQAVGPQINRFLKSDITAGFSGFSPGFAASATNTLVPLTVDESAGWLYQPSRGNGASSNFVYRVPIATMTTINSTLTLGVSQFVGKVLVDDVNNKLYVVINSGATTNQIVRLNRTTFASEATFNGGTSANGVVFIGAQIDVPHQKIYVPIAGTGAGGVARVEKVNLCS